MTGIVSASTLVSEARTVAPQGRDAIARVIARHDWATPLYKILRGLWADAYLVGWVSSGGVLAHHGVATGIAKAEVRTITFGVDWGGWHPGDSDAAKTILGRADALGSLFKLVDTGERVADAIVVSRMDRLAHILIDGIETGKAPATIATALKSVLANPQWAHMVALTETTRASTSATLLRYNRNGVEAVEWATALDQRVCPRCQVNEDQGAIPIGSTFPDGTDGPPAHPLCRCALYPAWLTADEARAQGAYLGPLAGEEIAAAGRRGGFVDDYTERPMTQREAQEAALEQKIATAKADSAANVKSWERAIAREGPNGDPATLAYYRGALENARNLPTRLRQELADVRKRKDPALDLPHPTAKLRTGTPSPQRAQAYMRGQISENVTGADRAAITGELERQAALVPRSTMRLGDVRFGEIGEDISFGGDPLAAYSPFNDVLYSRRWMESRAAVEESVQRSITSKWWTRYDGQHGGIGGTTAHEFGHHIDRLIGRTPAQAKQLAEAISREFHFPLDPKALDFRAEISRFVSENEHLVSVEISRYGAKNANEMFAEIWREYSTMGTAARPKIRRIGELMRQLAEDNAFGPAGRVAGQAAERALALEAADLSVLKLPQLRALAKERGLTGYSKLTKPQLLERLGGEATSAVKPAVKPDLAPGYSGARGTARRRQREEVLTLVRDAGGERGVQGIAEREAAEALESMGYLRRTPAGNFALTDKGRAYFSPTRPPVTAEVPLAKLKVPELRALAKERGIAGYSKLTKPQLLERLGARARQVETGTARSGLTPAEFETRATAARTDKAAERLAPIRVEVDASAGSDVGRWKATTAQGYMGSPTGLLSAVTRRVRVSGPFNDYLRFPEGRPLQPWEIKYRESLTPEFRARLDAIKAGERTKEIATAQRDIKALDKAMEQSRLPSDAIVWRGGRLTDIGLPDGSATGFEWTDPAYVGTSATRAVAEESFAGQGEGFLLRILATEGTPAISITGGGEGELLLGRGLRFRVIADRGLTKSGARLLDVQIIPKTEIKAVEKDLVAAARERQAAIDFARARADLLTEAEHWLDSQGSFETMGAQLRRDAKRLGVEGHKDVAALFRALDSGSEAKVRKAIDVIAGKQKLARIESAGDVVRFDRTKHAALGKGVRDGQYVVVVRPGYTFDRGGEIIRLHKATVQVATKEDIAAAQAKRFDDMLANAKSGNMALKGAPTGVARDQWHGLDAIDAVQRDRIKTAVDDYRRVGYRMINEQLRTGSIASRARQIEDLDAALATSPLRSNIVLWRGLDDARTVFGPRTHWPEDFTGFTWQDKAYSSASATRAVAQETFATDIHGVLLRLVVPKGTLAIQLSDATYEAELLLQRGLRFRVIRDRYELIGRPLRVLDVEVLPAE